MPSFDYMVPLPFISEDNQSFVNKVSILFKDAGSFNDPNEDCLGWNYNHCPNDNDYCQPFIKGDKIYMQFLFDLSKYKFIDLQFIHSPTGEQFDGTPALIAQSATDENRNTYSTLVIDTTNAVFDNIDCWYIRIKMYRCDYRQDNPDTPAYNTCRAAKIAAGKTAAEAKRECYDELCDDFDYYTSEPYCRVACNQASLLLSGVYTEYDCNGNFYGKFLGGTPTSIFKLQVRIIGTIDPIGFVITETRNAGKKVKSQQQEKFLLRSGQKLPYYVARQIVACFNSQQLIIDGLNYDGAIKLEKNFDEGSMWILSENVYQNCDEINFTCT